MRLHGLEAIDYATVYGLTLSKYADPSENSQLEMDLSTSEALEIAKDDPNLIYLDINKEKKVQGNKPGDLPQTRTDQRQKNKATRSE